MLLPCCPHALPPLVAVGEWATSDKTDEVQWKWHNKYTTTIHAINSAVVKCSRLTKVLPLYRGWTGATLPESFFEADDMGVKGGVEYGFSSTTTERDQAVHYAQGKASTLLELQMGMLDRGADIRRAASACPYTQPLQLCTLCVAQLLSRIAPSRCILSPVLSPV